MRDIIQIGGGTFSGFLAKSTESGSQILSKAREDMERSFAASSENLRGTFQITQRAAEDLKRAIEERVHNPNSTGRDALTAAQAQLRNLNSQLSNIEKLIEAVESRAGNA